MRHHQLQSTGSLKPRATQRSARRCRYTLQRHAIMATPLAKESIILLAMADDRRRRSIWYSSPTW